MIRSIIVCVIVATYYMEVMFSVSYLCVHTLVHLVYCCCCCFWFCDEFLMVTSFSIKRRFFCLFLLCYSSIHEPVVMEFPLCGMPKVQLYRTWYWWLCHMGVSDLYYSVLLSLILNRPMWVPERLYWPSIGWKKRTRFRPRQRRLQKSSSSLKQVG